MEESKKFSHFGSDQNIQQWLKNVFQEDDIPSFEETPEFIESLKKIMSENDAAEKDAKALIRTETVMKDFYNEKAEELQLIIDFIQLNSETCRRIETLASLAENMKLKEPSLTNFLLALTEIEDKEFIQAEKKLFTTHHMSVFSKKIMQTVKTNYKMKKHLKSLTGVVDMQETHYPEINKQMLYFKMKKTQMEEKIKDSRESLENAGYFVDKDIRHSLLVEKAQKLKDLEEHKKILENKLQAYHSLPPNLDSTVMKVNNTESELLDLENNLQVLLQTFEAM